MNIEELAQAKPWMAPLGLLGHRESLLCYHIARDYFQGLGTVVDAGSFLGKSAFHFAQGLRLNPAYDSSRDRIQCFDNFIVNSPDTARFIAEEFGQNLSLGDSTRALFDLQVAPFRDMLDVYAGDFHTIEWPGRPIEILFVDIAKLRSLNARVAELLYSNLIPGRSLVIHQDYHHPWLPYIHITMEYLAPYFEIVIPRVDDTAVFRNCAAIPEQALRRVIEYDFTRDEENRLFESAIARFAENDQFYVRLARVVFQLDSPEGVDLERQMDDIQNRFPESRCSYPKSCFQHVQSLVLEKVAQRCLNKSDYRGALEATDKVAPEYRSSYIMTLRGEALLELNRHSEAEEQLRAAIERKPPQAFAYIHLTRTLLAQGRLAEAESELVRGFRNRDANEVDPKEFLFPLEEIWQQRPGENGKRKETLGIFRSELPADAAVWGLYARLCVLAGDLEQAESAVSRAAELGLDERQLSKLRAQIRSGATSPIADGTLLGRFSGR